VGLVDALAGGLEQECGVWAAAAEEEAPEERAAPVRPVERGAHLGVTCLTLEVDQFYAVHN
jgi:hypothetical protein